MKIRGQGFKKEEVSSGREDVEGRSGSVCACVVREGVKWPGRGEGKRSGGAGATWKTWKTWKPAKSGAGHSQALSLRGRRRKVGKTGTTGTTGKTGQVMGDG